MFDRYDYHTFTGVPMKRVTAKKSSGNSFTFIKALKLMGTALVLAGTIGYMSQLQSTCEAQFGTNSINCVEK